MAIVDVYFGYDGMYNLEDMSLLGKMPSGSPELLYEHLNRMKEEYTIGIAMIGLNHPLRNAIYTVFPKATVIINPQDVQEMISHYLGAYEIGSAAEEIAAGIEGNPLVTQEMGYQEAIHYYRQWQGEVPLGVKSFHHVIRTIDYYYEEIFNYFEFKEILYRKHHKIR